MFRFENSENYDKKKIPSPSRQSFGWRKENNELVPIPEEQEIIEYICTAGVESPIIASEINENSDIKPRRGKEWTGRMVREMKKKYEEFFVWNGKPVQDSSENVVKEEIIDGVYIEHLENGEIRLSNSFQGKWYNSDYDIEVNHDKETGKTSIGQKEKSGLRHRTSTLEFTDVEDLKAQLKRKREIWVKKREGYEGRFTEFGKYRDIVINEGFHAYEKAVSKEKARARKINNELRKEFEEANPDYVHHFHIPDDVLGARKNYRWIGVNPSMFSELEILPQADYLYEKIDQVEQGQLRGALKRQLGELMKRMANIHDWYIYEEEQRLYPIPASMYQDWLKKVGKKEEVADVPRANYKKLAHYEEQVKVEQEMEAEKREELYKKAEREKRIEILRERQLIWK